MIITPNKFAQIIEQSVKDRKSSYMDAIFDIPTTAHILGGAIIGTNSDKGVIDENFDYKDLKDYLKEKN